MKTKYKIIPHIKINGEQYYKIEKRIGNWPFRKWITATGCIGNADTISGMMAFLITVNKGEFIDFLKDFKPPKYTK